MAAHNSISNTLGQRFGKLVLIGEAPRFTYARKWFARCDCGNEQIVWQHNLRSGLTTCCGECSHSVIPVPDPRMNDPLYIVWQHMRARCEKTNAPDYRYFGARGISVCKEWKSSFDEFQDWSIDNGYVPGLFINLRDDRKDYGPDNCEWSTAPKVNRDYRGGKLDIKAVRDIRAKILSGMAALEVAKHYDISHQHVYAIIAGKKWKDIL